jgi:hypothetical protein
LLSADLGVEMKINGVELTEDLLASMIFMKVWKTSKYVTTWEGTREVSELIVDMLKDFEEGVYPDPTQMAQKQAFIDLTRSSEEMGLYYE